jgi:hypothetical protein
MKNKRILIGKHAGVTRRVFAKHAEKIREILREGRVDPRQIDRIVSEGKCGFFSVLIDAEEALKILQLENA